MSTEKPRMVVVGGGITGAFAAYFLARLGVDCTLVERDQVAAHASGANAGGLNPLHGPGIPGPMQALALAAHRLHLDHWSEIRRLSEIDFDGQLVPRLQLALDDRELAELAPLQSLYDGTPGFSARLLHAPELRRREPRAPADAAGGLWTEGNARVDPARYTRAVAGAAAALGARLMTAEVRGLRSDGDRVTGVSVPAGTIDCDGVVLAPGPWCEAPADWLAEPLPVQPVKGELLLVALSCAAPAAEVSWRGFGVYRAVADGAGADTGDRVWLGGTEDRAGFDAAPTDSARERILDGIRRMLPGLGQLRVIRHVAALRPVSRDGLPIVGLSRRWQNVCVAVGSGRKGMLLSAGLGLAAAELLTSGRTGVPIGACTPQRPGLVA